MKPVDQTIFSSEDGSVNGNCFPSCLASLLELPIDQIPAFQDMSDSIWFEPFCKFLAKHGYEFVDMFYFPMNGNWADLIKQSPGIDGFFMVGGTSPRSYVTAGHAVIYKDGNLVHDPHFSKAGLTKINYAYMIERKTP